MTPSHQRDGLRTDTGEQSALETGCMDTANLHSSDFPLSRLLGLTRTPLFRGTHSLFMYINKVKTITLSSCQPKNNSLFLPQSLSIFLCFFLSLTMFLFLPLPFTLTLFFFYISLSLVCFSHFHSSTLTYNMLT